ncbi:MAG: glycine--tRNA ligase subunit beta [Betaproteobacteria bacterium]|nr:glycine--tRNA ligase subunit beta [Betaproteobacteria bacterium]
MTAALLIELLCEELPPKSLTRLSDAFSLFLSNRLVSEHYIDGGETQLLKAYATPRRLAVVFGNVRAIQPDRAIERKGPSVAAGMKDGQPTPALLGFARSCGVAVDELHTMHDGRQECYVWRTTQPGAGLDETLAAMVTEALAALPTPKRMRWGSGEVEFVRPVHGLVMLHGDRVVPGQVMGLHSGRVTRGHRFLSSGEITLTSAGQYAQTLREAGHIEADFGARREQIRTQLVAQAGTAQVLWDDTLLDEVTALVETPVVYRGEFGEQFLAVPQECLILSMKQHQKYFPLADATSGRLLPGFLVVSNLPGSAQTVVHGNERVLRARLSDARFFFEQDRRRRLDSRIEGLAHVVYHNRLGSQLERVERIARNAAMIAHHLHADAVLAERAARLAKADLLTDMVGEFPELQGVMGRYYAMFDGEAAEVADAIAAHYQPRFAGDALPEGAIAVSVALADKLDTLVGIFGIGQPPTGDKDPFGLRRAGLGVLRIIIETPLPLSLTQLIGQACASFPTGWIDAAVAEAVHVFLLDRLRNYLREQQYDAAEIEAVLARQSDRLDDALARMAALREFRRLPEAPVLAAANKRVVNLLKKAEDVLPGVDPQRFVLPAEQQLHDSVRALQPIVAQRVRNGEYTAALSVLAGLRQTVDTFFDSVMVMAEDPAVRSNRLALLRELGGLLNEVADISVLPG